MRKELLKAFYLPVWKTYTNETRKQIIEALFEYYKAKFKFDYVLTFIPPKGFETAFANCDWSKREIFVNSEYIKPNSLFCLYNVIHEIRHAIQKQLIEQCKRFRNRKNIIKKFTYYFQYNGEALRFSSKDDTIFTYQIKQNEQFCLELYLRNPVEADADSFALKEFKKHITLNMKFYGIDEETQKDLEKIIDFCHVQPRIFTPEKENRLLLRCDDDVK